MQRLALGKIDANQSRKDLTEIEKKVKELSQTIAGNRGMESQINDLRLYHHAYSKPHVNFPEISSDAKAIILAVPGSGVASSSGRNFMMDARTLDRYQISLIGISNPFHTDGPTSGLFNKRSYYIARLLRTIRHFKQAGIPVYLLGHSFGPAIIQEIMGEATHLADGYILLSPAGEVSPSLTRIAQNRTEELKKFINENGIEHDPVAGEWARRMLDQFKFNKSEKPFKTERPTLIMSGTEDFYMTPDLFEKYGHRFANSKLVMVPKGGHVLFKTPGKVGNIVTDHIIDFMREHVGTPAEPVKLDTGKADKTILVQYYYENSLLFREYVASLNKSITAYVNDDFAANSLLDGWPGWASTQLKELVRERMLALTEKRDPSLEELQEALRIRQRNSQWMSPAFYEGLYASLNTSSDKADLHVLEILSKFLMQSEPKVRRNEIVK